MIELTVKGSEDGEEEESEGRGIGRHDRAVVGDYRQCKQLWSKEKLAREGEDESENFY